MEEDQIKFFKDLVDGLKKQDDLFQQLGKINTWMRDCIGVALGRYAERSEQSESWQSSQNSNLPVGTNCSSIKESDFMKNVRHREDGRWEYRKQIQKQSVSIIKPTKEQLLIALKKIRKKPAEKLIRDIQDKSFGKFSEYWLETFKAKTVSPACLHSYRNILKNHLTPLNEIMLKDIRLSDIQQVINTKTGRVRELCYLTIKQILKQAYYEDYIKKDLAQFVVKGKIEKHVRRNLNFREQEILWNSLKDDHLSLLIKFYLLTGARRAEAQITKENLFKETNGCFVLLEGTKTESSKRYVKISEKLYDELMAVSGENVFYRDWKSIEKRFRVFVKEIGLKEISIHRLRHTFSTNLQVLEVPDKLRQNYLGHASIVTTNDVYTHLDPTLTKEKLTELYGEYIPRYI